MKIAALMLTGEAFYAGRAKACYETWLQDFDSFQIHSFEPCDFLPITKVGTREGRLSCCEKRFMGFSEAENILDADIDWFLCCSCDNYVWRENLAAALGNVDTMNPMIVGAPFFQKQMDDGSVLHYHPGGAGYCLNRAALFLLAITWRALHEDQAVSRNDLWEDGFMGFAAQKLKIKNVEHRGFHQGNPLNKTWPFQVPREDAISYHYMTEVEIRALHAEGKVKCCA